MQLKRRVALDGVQLDSLDNRILITGIDEAAGKESISAVSLGGGYGQRITNRRRESLDVTVKFTMNIKNNDMASRDALLDTINAWAVNGGILTVGHKTGKRLNVVLAQAPGGGDQFNWTNEYTIVFRAYTIPYWENTSFTVVNLDQASSGTGYITVPGSADTVANATVTNKSGSTINNISLTIGTSIISFSNLGLANNAALAISYTSASGVYVMRARIGTSSVLSKKTGADDFILKPGENAISWTADGDVTVAVSCRGRYT